MQKFIQDGSQKSNYEACHHRLIQLRKDHQTRILQWWG